MPQLPHDNITPFGTAGSKKQQVGQMFDDIAPKYDAVNRFLSVGIDISWRKKAIGLFKKDRPQHILDVATGTADMAIMAAKQLQPAAITGIDISEGMLEVGRRKVTAQHLQTTIELHKGDSETINFPPNAFDGVMVAFGVRNFENLQQGLAEILRVLKPGSQLVALEFSKPRLPGIRNLYSLYMGLVAPQMAGWFGQNKDAYRYLNKSAKAFPERQQFLDILKSVGYSNTYYKSLSLGICCIYSARKPAS